MFDTNIFCSLVLREQNMFSLHFFHNQVFQSYPEQRHFHIDETDEVVLSSCTMRVAEQRGITEKRHGVAVMTQDVYNAQRKNISRSGVG